MTSTFSSNTHIVEYSTAKDGNGNDEYDLDKMRERKEAMNDELVTIDTRIMSLEEELEVVALTEKQIEGLRSAAAQFNGKLDTLSETQKKVFMQFFVERVDVTRVPVSGKAKMKPILTVLFRFLPRGRTQPSLGERTHEAQQDNNNPTSENENNVSGGGDYAGYNPIKYRFTLEYYKEIHVINGRRRAVMKTEGVAV